MNIAIIPEPLSIKITKVGNFELLGNIMITGEVNSNLIKHISNIVHESTDMKVVGNSDNAIHLELLKADELEEYQISVVSSKITISGGTEAAIFYGIMTLRQLFILNKSLSDLTIIDKPRYRHRGMMLDVSRHFINTDEIKRILDIIAAHKMNVFHWHLTDDQGWRIEIPGYPLLTTKGATRAKTKEEEIKDEKSLSNNGFYSVDEIKEIIKYASDRYIEIIPEIDMPGHISSAIHAYPKLSCTQETIEVPNKPGIYEDVLCVGNNEVYKFVDSVLDLVINLFPSNRVHLGGDEVPVTRWIECDKCRSLAKEKGIKYGEGLQHYFTEYVIDYLSKKGKRVILWNDSFDKPFEGDNVECQYWRDDKNLSKVKNAEEMNCNIIDSNWNYYYLDYPYYIKQLNKAYNYNPEKTSKKTIGVECPLWTERVYNTNYMNYMLFPRTFAVAETGWSIEDNKNYGKFERKLFTLEKLYAKWGLDFKHYKDWNVENFTSKLKFIRLITKMISFKLIIKLIKNEKNKKKEIK